MATLGHFPYSELVFYGWQITGFLNLLSLQVAMFARARQVQHNHEAERTRLLDQLTRHNQRLEEQVSTRTQSLSIALGSVQQAESEQRQLLSMASHEFRTPAAMIKASLDSLTYLQDSIAPEVQTRLENIRRASARMLALSNNLIDQDRLIELSLKPRLQPVDLCALVAEVLAHYAASDQVQARLPDAPVTVNADASLLSIALHNLIDNALRYGQPTEPDALVPATPCVTVTLCRLPDALELQVADLGPGIVDAEKQKVFERFHAVAHGGRPVSSGLGLAIVQSITQAHGGQALVRDNLPHGAVLVLRLPV